MNKEKDYKPKSCVVCSKDFNATGANSKYCSRKCQWGEQICEYCTKKFIKQARTKYCNRICQVEASKLRRHTFTSKEGYVYVYVGRRKFVTEHRMIMERFLERPLKKNETVHHINGIRSDNRIENLQLRTGPHGVGIKLICLDCGSNNIEASNL